MKGKMRRKISKKLAKHKDEKLGLVAIDIARPFPRSLRGNRVFMRLVDNHTRKTWSLPLPGRDHAPSALESWKKKEELATRLKLKAVRADNALELKIVIDK